MISAALQKQLATLRATFSGHVYTCFVIDEDNVAVLCVPHGAQHKEVANPLGVEVDLDAMQRGVSDWDAVETPFIMRVSATHVRRMSVLQADATLADGTPVVLGVCRECDS